MILQSAGQDLGRRCAAAVDQYNDWILRSTFAMFGGEFGLRRRTAVMGNDSLALVQKMIGHADCFVHQSARVIAQVENQALHLGFAQFGQRLVQFLAGVLVESVNFHERDSGTVPVGIGHAIARHLIANDVEGQRLRLADAFHHHLGRCSAGTFQHR